MGITSLLHDQEIRRKTGFDSETGLLFYKKASLQAATQPKMNNAMDVVHIVARAATRANQSSTMKTVTKWTLPEDIHGVTPLHCD